MCGGVCYRQNHTDCWVWATPVIFGLDEAVWAQNEPNRAGRNENCMALWDNTNWYSVDIKCALALMYLCKRDVYTTNLMQPTLGQVYQTTLC